LTGAHTRVEVLHGVNLDMLGKRDPEHYGTLTLVELEVRIRHWARQLGLEVSFFHTNSEREYVERLHQVTELADALLLNPGAWTHYSYAIRDALEIADMPAVEIHLSDVSAREEWRRHSVLADLVLEQISGRGVEGYREALELIARELDVQPPEAA
jgi:3-dehydroquinate dehydratase II